MKKFTISFFVITSFIIYALYQSTSGVNSASVSLPNNTSNSLAVGTTPTGTQATPTDATQPLTTPTDATTPTQAPTPTPVSKPTTSQTPPPPPTPTPTPKPTQAPVPTPVPTPKGQYNNGTYTGNQADAYYGTVQVQAVIQNGKIADVIFLSYPNDRRNSVAINSQAMPYLKQEAIQAQNANVDIVSGATDTSIAFQQSLASALAQAKG